MLVEVRDPLDGEAGERPPKALALAQDREPGEPRLKAFEREQLEHCVVAACRTAPLVVVIGAVQRVVSAPAAAGGSIRVEQQVEHRSILPIGSVRCDVRADSCERAGLPRSSRHRPGRPRDRGGRARRRGVRHGHRRQDPVDRDGRGRQAVARRGSRSRPTGGRSRSGRRSRPPRCGSVLGSRPDECRAFSTTIRRRTSS